MRHVIHNIIINAGKNNKNRKYKNIENREERSKAHCIIVGHGVQREGKYYDNKIKHKELLKIETSSHIIHVMKSKHYSDQLLRRCSTKKGNKAKVHEAVLRPERDLPAC